MKLDKKTASIIREDYAAGKSTIEELAEQYHVSVSSIRHCLLNNTFYDPNYKPELVGLRPPKLKQLVDEITSLRQEGMSFHEIGCELGRRYKDGRDNYSGSAVRNVFAAEVRQ